MTASTSHTEVITINANNAMMKMSAAGAGVGLSYFTLNEWVQVLTILFLLLQIVLLIPKYVQLLMAWSRKRKVKVELE